MTTTYVQFKLLAGTETRKAHKREIPPPAKPQNANAYRYFDLAEDISEHLANQYTEKDMLNASEWKHYEEKTTRP